MRVYRFHALSSIDDLHLNEEEMPKPQRGELLLRVHAVSLNYRDVAMVLGRYPEPSKAGLIPTSDAAAQVVAIGEGVESYKPGDRVIGAFNPRWFGGPQPSSGGYGSSRDGWLAEYKVVSQEAVVSLPDAISYEQGSTLPCAAATAWNALAGATPIRTGRTVLTLGTGGVSIFALQLAKTLGARVIATTSSARKADKLKELGADKIINYSDVRHWGAQVRELTGGRGVDRVVEVGGPGTINESLQAVAPGGSVVLVGFLSQDEGKSGIDYFRIFGSGALVYPIHVGDRPNLEELVQAVSMSGLEPVIDRVFEFDDAKHAFALLQSGKFMGKIVIRTHN